VPPAVPTREPLPRRCQTLRNRRREVATRPRRGGRSLGRGRILRTPGLPRPRVAFGRLLDHASYGAVPGLACRSPTRKHLPERQTSALRGSPLRQDPLKILIVRKDRSHPFAPYSWTADHGAAVGSQRGDVGAMHTGTRTVTRAPERSSR
jgi:hypothetical protein